MNLTRLIKHGIQMMMPFLDQIATRALILFSLGLGLSLLGAGALVVVYAVAGGDIPAWMTYILMLTFTLSFFALVNFLILFAVFSQSQGRALLRSYRIDD